MSGSVHKIVVLIVAVVALVWTLASLVTLVYWSGLALWIAGAIAAGTFAWTLRVYLRPTQPAELEPIRVSRPSV
jgi:hypothetical protein